LTYAGLEMRGENRKGVEGIADVGHMHTADYRKDRNLHLGGIDLVQIAVEVAFDLGVVAAAAAA